MADEVGRIRTMMPKGKTLAAHGTTAGSSILATIFAIQQMFGPLSGLADVQRLKDKADTVIAVETKVNTIEANQAKQETKLDKIEDLLIGLAAKQNIKIVENRDTVIIHFLVGKNDTASSFWRRGTTTDSLMIPIRDTL